MMSPERWPAVAEWFDAALDQPVEERAAWVRAACEEPDVCAEVVRLLRAHQASDDFLERSALDVVAEDAELSVDGKVGRHVGAYRLIRLLGRGGMGRVYLAERGDGQFEQQVALKLLRRDAYGERFLRDFLDERQILASLNHPHIARLFDGGMTAEGTPYFVMEYVEGQPIDVYCRERVCSTAERLALFKQVCSAVQYAHQNLVVHRDLKPSNILVTADGVVKLLDFGIARLVDPEGCAAGRTRTARRWMTPGYASPEQVRGDALKTASDVYQLGVVLYELLTGERPFDVRDKRPSEVERIICETEPRPPSSAAGLEKARRHALRGDLDTIVLKALRKEPEERYVSVEALMGDLRRYLERRPVEARRGSSAYRFRKFVQRHRGRLAVAVLAVLLSVGAVVAIVMQKAQAERERDRAETYAQFMSDLFASPDPFGDRVTAQESSVEAFLARGAERARTQLADDPTLQARLLKTIAHVYQNLGYTDAAATVFEDVLERQEMLYGPRSPEVVETLRRLAWVSGSTSADSLYAVALQRAHMVEQPPGTLTARTLVHYGHFLYEQGHHQRAEATLGEAHLLASRLSDEQWEVYVGALYFLGMTKRALGELSVAKDLLQEAYGLRANRDGPDHPHTAIVMTELGGLAKQRGELDDARRWNERALRVFEKELGPEHPYTMTALNNHAVVLMRQTIFDEAEEQLRRVLAHKEQRQGPDHRLTVDVRQNLATVLLRQEKLDAAEPLFRQVYAQYRATLPVGHHQVAYPLLSLTDVHLQQAAYHEAEETARQALEHLEGALPDGHPLRAIAASRLGAALAGAGHYDEAERWLEDAYQALKAATGYHRYAQRACARLQSVHEAQGQTVDSSVCSSPH